MGRELGTLNSWMNQLKIDPDKCCHSTKRFILNDLNEQKSLAKIYMKYKKKKLSELVNQMDKIEKEIKGFSCAYFHGWIGHQLEQPKEDVSDIITKAAKEWAECEDKQWLEIEDEIETRRSKHWETTGELL